MFVKHWASNRSDSNNFQLKIMSFKLFLIIALLAVIGQAQTVSRKFDFGSGKTAKGYTPVTATDVYSREKGFGFEPGANVECPDGNGKKALHSGVCASDQPFYFSAVVPGGNYLVTVTFGDAKQASVTTVKAELRRLMLERVVTKAGEFV